MAVTLPILNGWRRFGWQIAKMREGWARVLRHTPKSQRRATL